MMSELADIQRKKAAASAKAKGEGHHRSSRKHKTGGESGGAADKENLMVDLDVMDTDSTLTGDTEEDSTPQATPREDEDE